MKENDRENIDELLVSEQKFRESKEYIECLDTCLKILREIKRKTNNYKYEIISKIFLYKDQSNYVRIYLMHALFQDSNFINTRTLKKKYYQLLINSFKNDTINDLLKEKKDIIHLFEKSNLDNFDEIDKYIVTLVSTPLSMSINEKEKNETENNLINEGKKGIRRNKSLSNIFLSTSSTEKRLKSEDTFLPQSSIQTSFDGINTIRQGDINSSVQKIIRNSEQKKNDIKQLLKKYKPNSHLPLIIMNVSANLNRNQFLEVINNIFLKLNYKLICNIKDTEFENINVYEYKPKNCCENFKYLFKNKYIKNEFQVFVVLKNDENNFTTGINTFLNDINERRISIKTIKGNEQSIIQFFINFLSKFCLSINKIKLIKQSKCLLKYNIEESIQKLIHNKKNEIYKSIKLPKEILKNSKNSNYYQLIDEETYVEKTNSQANKYYELYKILSKGEYELGKSIKSFTEDFKKNIKKCLLRK